MIILIAINLVRLKKWGFFNFSFNYLLLLHVHVGRQHNLIIVLYYLFPGITQDPLFKLKTD